MPTPRRCLALRACAPPPLRRVGAPGCPGAPLTEPDLWASHPALRDAVVRGCPRIPAPAFSPTAIPIPA
jgi:hypothetical protein